MLRSLNSLVGHKLLARDGALGKVKDMFFDDQAWAVRYVVVDTGGLLPGRQVLISPTVIGNPDSFKEALRVSLSKRQIEESPPVSDDKPVSRQHEEKLSHHFGWPEYWATLPGEMPAHTIAAVAAEEHDAEPAENDPHLRSGREVIGYHIQASDGEIGHTADLIVDTNSWVVRYLVVDTRNWLPGRKVLVARQWIDAVSWNDRKVSTDLHRQEIKESPEFKETEPVNRQYEERLYDYYGRPANWH